MDKRPVIALTLGAVMLLCASPIVRAQTCSGASDVLGPYALIANRSLYTGVPNNNVTSTSSTPIGTLVGATTGVSPFSLLSTVVADGAGHLFAGPNTNSLPTIKVGSYSVNAECTMSVALTDAFTAGSNAGTTFEGVIVDGANEVHLVQTSSGAATMLTLRRMSQSGGCTNATLIGSFGLVANTFSVSAKPDSGSSIPTITPAPLIGRITADGAGNLVMDNVASKSPLKQRQLTGTYVVRPDCTGTAHLIASDGSARNIGFALTPAANRGTMRHTVQFVSQDSGLIGLGFARQK